MPTRRVFKHGEPLSFVHIATASAVAPGNDRYRDSVENVLYGLTADGRVYEYACATGTWRPLDMRPGAYETVEMTDEEAAKHDAETAE